MQRTGPTYHLSATDLANRQACTHLTHLDRALADGRLKPPPYFKPMMEVLRERGLQHERTYLETLRNQGKQVTESQTRDTSFETARQHTLKAMQAGPDVIAQAALGDGRWRGYADLLLRVETPSKLGAYSYQPGDTKLALETKAGTILQLCVYAELVEAIQGVLPDTLHVITPRNEEHYRTRDYLAYFHRARRDMEAAIAIPAGEPPTYPEPVAHCEICRWWAHCNKRRRADDHLSFVADVSRLQRRELVSHDIGTLASLAAMPVPLEWQPERGSKAGYEKAHEQARIQHEERDTGNPVYELLPLEPDTGLARLPAPSPGDVFFDIEGDPFAGEQGLEYLFGYVTVDTGTPRYHGHWALTPAAEKTMFETFIDRLAARARDQADFHVYHFAPYEPAALKRLMGRHATREDELDVLLRAERFVDLHAVVRQALRASVERYSIKDLEKFFGYTRDIDLRAANQALRAVEWPLELGRPEDIDPKAKDAVEGYNKDDCVSTVKLYDWLEGLRANAIATGADIARPAPKEGEPPPDLDAWLKAIADLQTALRAGLPAEGEDMAQAQESRWLLAHLLEYHRREDKAVWWEYFRLQATPPEALLDEKAGLYRLAFIDTVGGTQRCPIHRYRFPRQDCDLRSDTELHAGELRIGTLEALDHAAGTVDIKKTGAAANEHPVGVFGHSIVRARALEDALKRLAEWVRDNAVDAPGAHRAARNLLLRRPPLAQDGTPIPLRSENEPVVDAAKRIVQAMHTSVLAIQGPPGSGKTYTGARMICALVRAGKKVGITAVSHKAIRNLLDEVLKAATEEDIDIQAIQKPREKSETPNDAILETSYKEGVLNALQDGTAQVGAGTAWLWARPGYYEAVDVLFVDEAGQMALAQVLAATQAGTNLVLLGDPQQLEQPQQSAHPPGTECSALEHLLGDHDTMPDDLGLFLDRTWRLHPKLCEFTSELFYEDRLTPVENLDHQQLTGTKFNGAGLWYVPVEHNGNQNASIEEAEKVVELIEELLQGTFTDKHGKKHPLTLNDILIVTPYNAQVAAIAERAPANTRVGTVDKFQGQEAPVVIYSMTSSTPEDAPRGMEFLYSLSRLNVATSRAMAAYILVANPALFDPECKTPKHMHLANALCRYLELADQLPF